MKGDGTAAVSSLLALLIVLLRASGAAGSCDPSTDPDRADIANTRAAVAAGCDCASAPSHRDYVKCAATIAAGALVNADCQQAVRACAKRSTCGREGAVSCCRTTAKAVTKCSIKRDAGSCRAPSGGMACLGSGSSCCDACLSGCPVSTTTTTVFTVRCSSFDCSGFSCPPGEMGVILRSQCGCAPAPGCGGSGGVCGGNCPVDVPTEGCHFDTFNGCCLCGGP
jgi:hypothetical protein